MLRADAKLLGTLERGVDRLPPAPAVPPKLKGEGIVVGVIAKDSELPLIGADTLSSVETNFLPRTIDLERPSDAMDRRVGRIEEPPIGIVR